MQYIKTALALTVVNLLAVVPFAAAEDSADATREMKQITEALSKWRRSFVNLQFRCEADYVYAPEVAKEAGLEGKSFKRSWEWVWTDAGQRRNHVANFTDGLLRNRSMRLVDGNRRYQVNYPEGNSTVDRPKRIAIAPANPGYGIITEPLYGLWYNGTSEWISDLLEQGKGRLLGHQQIEGVRCPEVRVTFGEGAYMVVVLDPRHAFLPRSARTEFDVETDGEFRSEFAEFRQTAEGVWFPWSGTFSSVDSGKLYNKQTWQMSEVAMNRQLKNSLFHARPAKGTYVIDSFSGRRYTHGATKSDRAELKQQRAEEAKENLKNLQNLQQTGDPVDAVPRPVAWGLWLSAALLVACAGLLAAALRLRLKRTS